MSSRQGVPVHHDPDIADAAGMGKATVYHYFRSREEILMAVTSEIFLDVERSLGAALLRLDEPEDRLAALIQESLNMTSEIENLYIITLELWLMNLRNRHHEDFMRAIRDLHRDLRSMVGRMIDHGKKTGLFAVDIDTDALAVYLVTSFDGVAFHYLLDRDSFDLDHVTKEFIKFLLRHARPLKGKG
jgi:AcrR family transcriptional regulator